MVFKCHTLSSVSFVLLIFVLLLHNARLQPPDETTAAPDGEASAASEGATGGEDGDTVDFAEMSILPGGTITLVTTKKPIGKGGSATISIAKFLVPTTVIASLAVVKHAALI